ncbi:hypothetical protein [Kineococcus esterisolvens]|uniref:hypothetical protein n=1 Tax=unclassified Kineococcus TaxID=2621656 RepID=UPI003D7E58B5
MHTTLIFIHAAAATVALAAGLAAFRRPVLVGAHAVGTVLMSATLAGALWVGRGRNAVVLDVVFLALLVLSLVMSYRSVRAWQHRPPDGEGTSAGYVAAVGFNCISLITGLLAIAALRTGWGPVALVATGVLPTLVGRVPLDRAVHARQRPPLLEARSETTVRVTGSSPPASRSCRAQCAPEDDSGAMS